MSFPAPPASQLPMFQAAASATGLPLAVVEAQTYYESSYNANATSPAGAEGEFQFLPSTYQGLGFPAGTEYNPSEEVKAYEKFMSQLLNQYGGSIDNALAAYNAGSANSTAGQAYASHILGLAGQGAGATASGGTGGTGASTTSSLGGFPGGPFDPLNWPSDIFGAAENAIADPFKKIYADILAKAKPIAIRFGLIVLGAVIVLVGINALAKPASVNPVSATQQNFRNRRNSS